MIRYYTKDKERPYFTATCRYCTPGDILHEDCRVSRAAYESKLVSRSAQGRPLGLLMAWLLLPDPGTKALHVDLIETLSMEQREAGRKFVLGLAGSEVLFDVERPAGLGEPQTADGLQRRG